MCNVRLRNIKATDQKSLENLDKKQSMELAGVVQEFITKHWSQRLGSVLGLIRTTCKLGRKRKILWDGLLTLLLCPIFIFVLEFSILNFWISFQRKWSWTRWLLNLALTSFLSGCSFSSHRAAGPPRGNAIIPRKQDDRPQFTEKGREYCGLWERKFWEET